jgi:cytochrome P450/nitrite reductase/ring-hydroxylating ferredoxin subunit
MAMTKGTGTPQAPGSEVGWRVVGKAAAVLTDRPCAAAAEGVELVLVQSPAGLRAYEARCPHQGTLLSEGDIVGAELVCRAHGWRFDLATGERKDAVPKACLRPVAVKTDGANVLVRLVREQASNALLDKRRAKRTLADLPGPRGWPLFGNALQIDVQRVHRMLEDWARVYGRIYKLSVMGKPAIVISDAELAESLLRARPKLLRRSGAIEPVFAEMGTSGVFSAEGDAWRAQRRLAMQALSNRHLRTFFPTLRRVTERLRQRWARAATSGEPVDIDDDLMRFTVDVTTSLVFSTDMDTLSSGDDVLQRQLSLVFPAFARRLLAGVPYWRFFRLPSDRALDSALAEIRKVQEQLVAETHARLASRAAGDDEPRDFIEAMLLARDEDGQPFGDDVVYGNMMTMLLAGEDTTAHSLAWVVHYLCDHPHVVARMRSEVDAALGGEQTPGDFEKAQRMPYLDAVASETMRLSPVAPFLGLETNEEMVIDDILVPQGTWVDLMTRLPALDDTNFGEAEQFRPERWLEERPKGCPHVPSASMPFGSGPRICPGRSLALLEMRVVLATLVRNFELERVGAASDVREHFAFTMSPRGLRVRLSERQVP